MNIHCTIADGVENDDRYGQGILPLQVAILHDLHIQISTY